MNQIKRNLRIYIPRRYGLSVNQLRNELTRKARFHIYFSRNYSKSIFKLTPKDRLRVIDKQVENNYLKLIKVLKIKYKLLKNEGDVYGLSFNASVKDIFNLQRVLIRHKVLVEEIWVNSIEGIKSKKVDDPSLFTIVSLISIEIEGNKKSEYEIEERHVIVRAKDANGAKNVFLKKHIKLESPYLNTDGFIVRFKLKKIKEVYKIIGDLSDIQEMGLESYSKYV